jgi:hypothetical protein
MLDPRLWTLDRFELATKMLKTHKKQHSTLDAGLSTDFIFLITSYPPPATHLVTLVPHGA